MPEPAEVDMIRCGDELALTAAHGRWRRSRFRHSRHRRQCRARGGDVRGDGASGSAYRAPRAVEQPSTRQPERL